MKKVINSDEKSDYIYSMNRWHFLYHQWWFWELMMVKTMPFLPAMTQVIEPKHVVIWQRKYIFWSGEIDDLWKNAFNQHMGVQASSSKNGGSMVYAPRMWIRPGTNWVLTNHNSTGKRWLQRCFAKRPTGLSLWLAPATIPSNWNWSAERLS